MAAANLIQSYPGTPGILAGNNNKQTLAIL